MKKTFKGVVALFLALLMFATLLAGCAKEESKDQSAGQQTQKENADGTKEDKQASKEDEKDKPKEPETFTYYRRANTKGDNLPDNEKVLQAIIDKSGIKPEVVPIPSDAYKDKINLMVASGDEFDAFDFTGFGGHHWTEFYDKGALMKINDLIEEYGPNIKKYMEEGFKAVSTKDGELYGIPRKPKFPMGFIPTIRKDWLDKFGMEAPETLDEVENYLRAALTKDPNGNGQNDEVGFLPDWGFGGIESNFKPYFCGFNGERYWDDQVGKVMPIYAHPGYKAMLLEMREWYKEGLLYREFFTIKGNQRTDLLKSDRVAMTAGWYGVGGYFNELKEKNPKADVMALPPLKGGPSGKVGYSSNPIYDPEVMISSKSKNAAAVIKYINWMLSDIENYLLAHRGIKGTHWEWVDKDSLIIKQLDDPQAYDNYYAVGSFDGVEGFRFEEEATTPASEEDKNTRDAVLGAGVEFFAPFDYYVPYILDGTPAEKLTGDGKTMIEEARMQLILGEISEEDFDKALEKYMEIEGNILSEVWTKQYKEYTGK